jgi:hypothetical protein
MRFRRVGCVAGSSSPPHFNYDCPQSCVRACAKFSARENIKGRELLFLVMWAILWSKISAREVLNATGSVGDFA